MKWTKCLLDWGMEWSLEFHSLTPIKECSARNPRQQFEGLGSVCANSGGKLQTQESNLTAEDQLWGFGAVISFISDPLFRPLLRTCIFRVHMEQKCSQSQGFAFRETGAWLMRVKEERIFFHSHPRGLCREGSIPWRKWILCLQTGWWWCVFASAESGLCLLHRTWSLRLPRPLRHHMHLSGASPLPPFLKAAVPGQVTKGYSQSGKCTGEKQPQIWPSWFTTHFLHKLHIGKIKTWTTSLRKWKPR